MVKKDKIIIPIDKNWFIPQPLYTGYNKCVKYLFSSIGLLWNPKNQVFYLIIAFVVEYSSNRWFSDFFGGMSRYFNPIFMKIGKPTWLISIMNLCELIKKSNKKARARKANWNISTAHRNNRSGEWQWKVR
jgi:hypothetical protein